MDELIIKLTEIIEDLVKLNKVTINLLAQYMSVEEFEEKLKKITSGDDVISDGLKQQILTGCIGNG